MPTARLKAFLLTLSPDALSVEPLNDAARDKPLPQGTSAAIGSFDGVHRGHQRVIENAVAAAHRLGVGSSVICFDPHPQAYFLQKTGKASTPFRLMNLAQQLRAFEALGVDNAFVLRFNDTLSEFSADAFVQTLLRDTLRLKHVSCGFDFRFGTKGSGDAATLTQLGAASGFTTAVTPCQVDETGHKLSSSAVREALEGGNTQLAGHTLGRAQAYEGVVAKGDQLGRTIGFATANIDLGDYLRPKYGVYVTRTRLTDGQVFGSVTNVGVRPTVDGLNERFETHIFGLNHEIYGQIIEVELLHYLRPEQKFASFDDLKAQIARDAQAARDYLALG